MFVFQIAYRFKPTICCHCYKNNQSGMKGMLLLLLTSCTSSYS